MARIARVDAAGTAHHVMVWGIERRQIFVSEEDRRDFVARLERLLLEEEWRCFAWAAVSQARYRGRSAATEANRSELLAHLRSKRPKN